MLLLEDLRREAGLLDLPRERPLRVADVEVADELLRDRRAALDDVALARCPGRGRARCPGSRGRRAARSGRPRSRPSPAAETARSSRAAAAGGSSPTGRLRAAACCPCRGTSSRRARAAGGPLRLHVESRIWLPVKATVASRSATTEARRSAATSTMLRRFRWRRRSRPCRASSMRSNSRSARDGRFASATLSRSDPDRLPLRATLCCKRPSMPSRANGVAGTPRPPHRCLGGRLAALGESSSTPLVQLAQESVASFDFTVPPGPRRATSCPRRRPRCSTPGRSRPVAASAAVLALTVTRPGTCGGPAEKTLMPES